MRCDWVLVDGILHCRNECGQKDYSAKIFGDDPGRWPKRICKKQIDIKPAIEKLEILDYCIDSMRSRLERWVSQGMPEWDEAEVQKQFIGECENRDSLWCKKATGGCRKHKENHVACLWLLKMGMCPKSETSSPPMQQSPR